MSNTTCTISDLLVRVEFGEPIGRLDPDVVPSGQRIVVKPDLAASNVGPTTIDVKP